MSSPTAALTDLTADERRQVMAAHLRAAELAAGTHLTVAAALAVADARVALEQPDLDAAASAVARAAGELRRNSGRNHLAPSGADERWRHLAACIPALAR